MCSLGRWVLAQNGRIFAYQLSDALPAQLPTANGKLPITSCDQELLDVIAVTANQDGHMIINPAFRHLKPLKGLRGTLQRG